MWTIFKVFIEFLIILHLFYVLVLGGLEAHGILAPWPGIKPSPPAQEGEVSTTGSPGKSLMFFFFSGTANPVIKFKPVSSLSFCLPSPHLSISHKQGSM